MFLFLMGCLKVFFPAVLILDESCQTHMDGHLCSFIAVDVGKDWDVCGHTSVFAHDLYPYGYYHTHRQMNTYSRKGSASVKTWPFSVCNLLAVGVNITHRFKCVQHMADVDEESFRHLCDGVVWAHHACQCKIWGENKRCFPPSSAGIQWQRERLEDR